MFPWLWCWAPQVHFPWSGSVSQDIAPNTDWFFGAIPRSAGQGDVEQAIFNTASYGRQIGLMQEVLLGLVQSPAVKPEAAQAALAELEKVHHEINSVKAAACEQRLAEREALVRQLETLRAQDAEGFALLLRRLSPPVLPAPGV